MNMMLNDVAFRVHVKIVFQLLRRVARVHQKNAARLQILHNTQAFCDIRRVMARNKIGFVHVIAAFDRRIAAAQMADSDAARFLGVVLKIRLYIFRSVVANNLDGVFVRSNCTIAAQTPKLALKGVFCSSVGRRLFGKRQMRYVIHNANRKFAARMALVQFLKNSKHR